MDIEQIDDIWLTQSINELLQWGRKHYIKYHPIYPVVIKEAEGAILRDTNKKEYLDFIAIAMAVNIGHNNEKVIAVMKEQLDQLTTITGSLMNVPQVKLAKLLAEIAIGDLSRSYFSCSGTEAVELAIKTIRRYTGRLNIISRWGGYHGNSLGAAGAASGTVLYKRAFESIVPGFIHIPPPYCYRCPFGLEYPNCGLACARALENAIVYESLEKIAGVIMELIIGGGGVIIPPNEYPVEIRNICNEYGVPLIIDEVVTGFGRTGKMFGCEHYNIVPEILVGGKGIAGAHIPLSFVLTNDKIARAMEDYTKGFHYSTYAHHPLACAAAFATIKVIFEENLVDRSAKLGTYALKALKDVVEDFDVLDDARGKGLMLGVEVVKSKDTKEPDPHLGKKIVEFSFKNGLLIGLSTLRMGNATIIYFAPPLTITEEQIDKALDIFRSAVKGTIQ